MAFECGRVGNYTFLLFLKMSAEGQKAEIKVISIFDFQYIILKNEGGNFMKKKKKEIFFY